MRSYREQEFKLHSAVNLPFSFCLILTTPHEAGCIVTAPFGMKKETWKELESVMV
jgi:hypothetical protein